MATCTPALAISVIVNWSRAAALETSSKRARRLYSSEAATSTVITDRVTSKATPRWFFTAVAFATHAPQAWLSPVVAVTATSGSLTVVWNKKTSSPAAISSRTATIAGVALANFSDSESHVSESAPSSA